MLNTKITFYIGLTTRDGQALCQDGVIQAVIVPTLADFSIDGFTVTEGVGYWKGVAEACLVVTVFSECPVLVGFASQLARLFAIDSSQECVLFNIEPAQADFAYA